MLELRIESSPPSSLMKAVLSYGTQLTKDKVLLGEHQNSSRVTVRLLAARIDY